MRVLIIGGSGAVGSIVTPYLQAEHVLNIFDLQPPSDAALSYIKGEISCYADLSAAMVGQDALVYMAMGSLDWDTVQGINSAYDINIKGLHLALKAAHEAGISQAVFTSSMSENLDGRQFADETVPPDALHLYGFTKGLGEQVCLNGAQLENACQRPAPQSPDSGRGSRSSRPAEATARDSGQRFQAFMISGDYQQKMLNMSKASLLLNWQPRHKWADLSAESK